MTHDSLQAPPMGDILRGLWHRVTGTKAGRTCLLAAVGGLVGAIAAVHGPLAGQPVKDRPWTETQRAEVVKEADRLATSLMSFAPKTFSRDVAEVTDLTTADLARRYQAVLTSDVADAVTEREATSTVEVVTSGVTVEDEESPQVLVFLRRQTSFGNGDRRLEVTALTLTLARTDGQWRITAIEPVHPAGAS